MFMQIVHYCKKHKKTALLFDFQPEKEGVIDMYCPRCEGGRRKLRYETSN